MPFFPVYLEKSVFSFRKIENALKLIEGAFVFNSRVGSSVVWIKLILKSIMLPPGVFFVLVFLSFTFWVRKKVIKALLLFLVSLLGLYLLSTPRIAYFLMSPLEEKVLPLPNNYSAQAIVILGGGQKRNAPEYGGRDTVQASTLQRLAYAAYLYRKTGLPILVSGGKVLDDKESEAKVMAQALEEIFSIAVKWTEDNSQNTLQNANYSKEILKEAGIKRILLVTEAWHMRRAILAFSSTGIEVTPAPTNFQSPLREDSILVWLPNADSLSISSRALHELLGFIWYRTTTP